MRASESRRCDACKVEIRGPAWVSEEYGCHCDVCYRLVVLGLIKPDGRRHLAAAVPADTDTAA